MSLFQLDLTDDVEVEPTVKIQLRELEAIDRWMCLSKPLCSNVKIVDGGFVFDETQVSIGNLLDKKVVLDDMRKAKEVCEWLWEHRDDLDEVGDLRSHDIIVSGDNITLNPFVSDGTVTMPLAKCVERIMQACEKCGRKRREEKIYGGYYLRMMNIRDFFYGNNL